METRENKTAVIYARVSSTGDRQSTERQVQDLNEYAEYRGLDLVRVFEEHISGAKRNEERPVLTDAVEFCLENRVGTLLVSELSRLGRNAFEVLSTVKTLADNGVNLYLQKEQLSLLDDEGKTSLFFPIVIATLSTCAQLERENIQFRLSSAPLKTPLQISARRFLFLVPQIMPHFLRIKRNSHSSEFVCRLLPLSMVHCIVLRWIKRNNRKIIYK